MADTKPGHLASTPPHASQTNEYERLVLEWKQTKKATEHVVGFVDIGTNAIRLLVVRINANLSYPVISQEKEVVASG